MAGGRYAERASVLVRESRPPVINATAPPAIPFVVGEKFLSRSQSRPLRGVATLGPEPKMAPFTYEDDVILIENVRQNRALYDNAHRGHNDTGFKDAIWDDISVKIGKSGEYDAGQFIYVLDNRPPFVSLPP